MLSVVLAVCCPAWAQEDVARPPSEKGVSGADDSSDLAKQTQNLGVPLLSVPFQLNFNGNVGAFDRTQTLLNLQPVLPVKLSDRFSLITRWILPLTGQPDAMSAGGTTWGVGDLNPQLFVAVNLGEVTLGAGTTVVVPTASAGPLGQGKLSIGPALLAVYTRGPWVVGALGTYAGSIAGDSNRPSVHLVTGQPFINFNLPQGAYVVTAPLIIHERDSDQTTVPIGGGVGKLFLLGKTPLNVSIHAYGNAVHPDGGPTWQVRVVSQFLFPQPAGGKHHEASTAGAPAR